MIDPIPPLTKPRLRVVLCDLSGAVIAQAKLTDTPFIEGDRALLRATLVHVLTLLPAPSEKTPAS